MEYVLDCFVGANGGRMLEGLSGVLGKATVSPCELVLFALHTYLCANLAILQFCHLLPSNSIVKS